MLKKIRRKILKKLEVVAPGYINFYLSPKYLQDKVTEINKEGEKFGNSELGKTRKLILNLFLPIRPDRLHLGNARGGPIGDRFRQYF